MLSLNKKTVSILVGSVYPFIALFGMSAFFMASEHGDMMGGGCPLMRDAGALCQTGIIDHITYWNLLFATTLALVVFSIVLYLKAYLPVRELFVSPEHERYKRYVKDHPHVRLFQNIVPIFSDGVIQPKLFA